MVKELYEAAIEGRVTSLTDLLKNDPLILDRCMVTSYGETPLHIAAMMGHVEFCVELLRRKPELAGELDSRRSSALHLASAKGWIEIVNALLSEKPDMCTARDCDGYNPLHVAAMKGKVGVLRELVRFHGDAAREKIDRGETILHLCVKYFQLDALKLLIEDLNDEELLNIGDNQGNTILHLAVADKQIEIIRYLVENTTIDVNARNSSGLTALEILAQSRRDAKDLDIADCLQQKSEEISSPQQKFINHYARVGRGNNKKKMKPKKHSADLADKTNGWGHYFNRHDHWLNKQRESLMIVASLIATMAFQAAVNPPGGVYQETIENTNMTAGVSIFADQDEKRYKRFVVSNTLSFISSLSIILLLISGLPLKFRVFIWILMVIMWIAVSSTAVTYLFSLLAYAPEKEDAKFANVATFIILGWFALMGLVILVHIIRLIIIIILVIFNTIRKVVRCCCSCMRRRHEPGSTNTNNIVVV